MATTDVFRKSNADPRVRDTWFGLEEPFPWLPIAACAIPILIIAFAIVLGITLSR